MPMLSPRRILAVCALSLCPLLQPLPANAAPEPGSARTAQHIQVNKEARALFITGFAHAHGNGVPKNYAKAREAYTQAAEMGYAPAQYNLARLYQLGLGCPKDLAQATRYFKAAAEQGLILAQYTLGTLYETGEGLARDPTAALQWYNKAAHQGDAPAQFRVGLFYEEGRGTKKDLVQAAFWYAKAAAQGFPPAQNNLGTLYQQGGEGLPANPKLAVHWYHKAAVTGHAQAQANLAACYRHGLGVAKDLRKADAWARRAAPKSLRAPETAFVLPPPQTRGQTNEFFGKSAIVERTLIPTKILPKPTPAPEPRPGILTRLWNATTAAARAHKKADQRPTQAPSSVTRQENADPQQTQVARDLFRAGLAYEKGLGTAKRSIPKALRFYRDAANRNYAPAAYRLGCMYEGHPSNEREKELAYKWFAKAAELGHAKAQFRLGRLFERGFGVEKDLAMAQTWYARSAASGNEDAKEALARHEEEE